MLVYDAPVVCEKSLSRIAVVLMICVHGIAFANTRQTLDQVSFITRFYRCYLDYQKLKHPKEQSAEKFCLSQYPLFSQDAQKLLNANQEACLPFKGEVCGFGANADMFLDAQDFDDKLNFKNSGFKAHQVSKDTVEVEFLLFPNRAADKEARRIQFQMTKDRTGWRVNDIIYKNGNETSMRKLIENEMKGLKK